MPTSPIQKEFRPSRWVFIIFALISITCGIRTIGYYFEGKLGWMSAFGLFSAVAVLATMENLFGRLTLYESHLEICSDFRKNVITKENVELVTWEKGCGATLKTRDGKLIRLPNFDKSTPQGMCNTIRAWLKRV